jgi:protocatechuate 3,4-dioxygenase beta subunit
MKGALNRRQALGTIGALVVTGCSSKSGGAAGETCALTPIGDQGPYFVDEKLNRSDLTTGTTEPFVTGGLPLVLHFRVMLMGADSTCAPLAGAQVDVWHASAEGVYSDEIPSMTQTKNTVGEKYLRGYQITDANGGVTFKTIYPGWYAGRTNHVHVTVRTFDADGRLDLLLTTLLLFDDGVNDAAMATPPYDTRGPRTTNNTNDAHQAPYGVTPFVIATEPAPDRGYVGTFTIGMKRA